MKQLVIKNVGPIRQVDIKLNRFNFFIGPQSSGKSTVAKILSSCMWLEKEVLTTLNDRVIADGAAFVRLVESFHKIEGYFEDSSFVQYDTDFISILYNNKDIKITRKENEDYHREKICYIPSERNIAALPELQGFEFGHTNLRSFLFDWFNAREFFVAGNKTDVLNLGVKYYYDSDLSRIKGRIEHVNGRAFQIALSSASSGLQSLTPLVVMLQYYTDEYFRSYNEKKSFDADCRTRKGYMFHLDKLVLGEIKPLLTNEEFDNLNQKIDVDSVEGNEPHSYQKLVSHLVVMLQYYTDAYSRSYNEKKSFDAVFRTGEAGMYLANIILNEIKHHLTNEEFDNLDQKIKDDILKGNYPHPHSYQKLLYHCSMVLYNLKTPKKTSFIIEEPEQNLYPSTQMDLLDLVVDLCNGERKHHCTITTHSPYILNKLNLLVKRFDVGVKGLAALNWDELSIWAVKDGEVRDLKVRNAHLINPEYLSEPLDRIYEEYEQYETATRE